MSQTAIAIARKGGSWSAQELDPAAAEDLDALADLLRDLSEEVVLGFVEEDDEYLGIIRVDGDSDPRVFLSDRRVLTSTELAARLFADALPAAAPAEDDDEAPTRMSMPAGDSDLLADLGTPADVLIELIGEEGMLPADVIAALGERAGVGDALDVLESVGG